MNRREALKALGASAVGLGVFSAPAEAAVVEPVFFQMRSNGKCVSFYEKDLLKSNTQVHTNSLPKSSEMRVSVSIGFSDGSAIHFTTTPAKGKGFVDVEYTEPTGSTAHRIVFIRGEEFQLQVKEFLLGELVTFSSRNDPETTYWLKQIYFLGDTTLLTFTPNT